MTGWAKETWVDFKVLGPNVEVMSSSLSHNYTFLLNFTILFKKIFLGFELKFECCIAKLNIYDNKRH